jgi:DNA polymerase/3'-5' exonuclease PolX
MPNKDYKSNSELKRNINSYLSNLLNEIGEYYKLEEDTFRSNAYLKAAQNIENFKKKINSGEQAKDEIEGIGKSISEDIDEFLNSKKIDRLEKLREKYKSSEQIIKDFSQIYGISYKKALKFYNDGYRTTKDLVVNNQLSEKQLLSLFLVNQKPIYRNEMNKNRKKFELLLNEIDFEMVGSYRRNEKFSTDVDLIVKRKNNVTMDKILKLLNDYILINFSSGNELFTGVMKFENSKPFRIDIRLFNEKNYYYGLLYFTGSKKFNILLRQKAKFLNMKLNEYGLYKNNRFLKANSEKDIFDHLGIYYIKPEKRTRNITELPIWN